MQPVERIQDRIHHSLGVPPEIEELRAKVRKFAEEEVAPVVPQMEEGVEEVASFPGHLFRRMAELDFFRLPTVNGLVLVESGTDGIVQGLVTSTNVCARSKKAN